jgi:hypothetical protein
MLSTKRRRCVLESWYALNFLLFYAIQSAMDAGRIPGLLTNLYIIPDRPELNSPMRHIVGPSA